MADNNKFGIQDAIDRLEDDAKIRVQEALKRAENTITLSTILSHWKEIVIVCLLIGAWIMYQRMDSAKRELATKNETFNQLQKISKIDETLKKVQENQDTVYPQIDATVQQIEAARAQLRDLNKKIEIANQNAYRAAAQKLNIDELSADLNSLGYPNKVVKGVQK